MTYDVLNAGTHSEYSVVMKIRAVLFDAYGTLFDVHSVALLAEQLFPGCGERLSLLWRDKQIEYTRLVTMSGAAGEHYRPFWELTRAGLQFAAARLGLKLDPASEDRLMSQYRHLSAFPENREVLAELQRRRIPAGILSNGDPEMLAVAVRRPRRLRLGHGRLRAAGARDSVRQQQRLGRHRRHLVRLYDAVGQPHRRTAGPAGHVAQPHRPQPARRAGPLSCPRFGRARAGGGRAGPPCRVKRGDSVSRRTP